MTKFLFLVADDLYFHPDAVGRGPVEQYLYLQGSEELERARNRLMCSAAHCPGGRGLDCQTVTHTNTCVI